MLYRKHASNEPGNIDHFIRDDKTLCGLVVPVGSWDQGNPQMNMLCQRCRKERDRGKPPNAEA